MGEAPTKENNQPVDDREGAGSKVDLSAAEEQKAKRQQPARAPLLFEVIRRLGEEEFKRPGVSLWWSGFAAGLMMGLSLLAEAVLQKSLPEFHGRELLTKLGYSTGFILVIAARQQLFTENTLTSVIPVFARPNAKSFKSLLRTWGLVFSANMVGTFAFAVALLGPIAGSADTREAAIEISRSAVYKPFVDLFVSGVGSGFLIATLVWIMAGFRETKFFPIVFITYLISVAGFAHIIAGSVEAWLLMLIGERSLLTISGFYLLPTLLGNVIGGTGLFALLAYGQTKEEMRLKSRVDEAL